MTLLNSHILVQKSVVANANLRAMKYIDPTSKKPLELTEEGLCDNNSIVFPKKNGAVRVVADDNYADNFGFQWNQFRKTQIDAEVKSAQQSKDRFFAETGWDRENLKGKNVLEVGSGAGRFSQVLLDYTDCTLFSVDYSNAVEANFQNNGHHGNRLKLFQASVYDMPFVPGSFDKVFCFGVLQHTPDVRRSVESLATMVKPGGQLVVDFYHISGPWTKVTAKYLLRPWTKKMNHRRLLSLIEKNIDWMISFTQFFNRLGLGKLVNRFVPICDIKGTFPAGLSKKQIREWAVLDTFDMFSPEYDQPQRIATVRRWFEELGFENISAGLVPYGSGHRAAVVKGYKPCAA